MKKSTLERLMLKARGSAGRNGVVACIPWRAILGLAVYQLRPGRRERAEHGRGQGRVFVVPNDVPFDVGGEL